MHPFTTEADKAIGAIGEAELIGRIRSWLGPCTPAAPYGMGDDCAVLQKKSNLSAIDPVIYGKHFDDSVSPQDAGAKLLKRNLSDIAAMGGKPNDALLALTPSANLRLDWIEQFIGGLREVAERYGVTIIGGDVAEAPGEAFIAHLTITGFAEKPIPRRGAKTGDTLWVTGSLGGSIIGKHYNFEPRLREGQWLADHGSVRGMIDLTDGLSKDLPQLLPDGAVALLNLDQIPLSYEAHSMAQKSNQVPLYHAFSDGEDYELAFALAAEAEPEAFLKAWKNEFELPLTCIGQISTVSEMSDDRLLNSETQKAISFGNGYEHLFIRP
ncbi:thiamine-phosphate kinase [Rubellicoccus peritrichatus]|uniref:Thiamine-monophosphate kinase n=1 Tax=Rubellicoccus peritrichatus TaxID=3080537 RepID=A0AAQ3LF86_9BACT|nr:thiamine-phosphate kinase [Puniceicoccus sp. CR14]WOO43464.1 thiamine-phosphate kinase [Puniceicoccus sp. CR14]